MKTPPQTREPFPALGGLTLGATPRVVGTLASREALQAGVQPGACDIAEARLDLCGVFPGWLDACRAIEATGTPVLVTLRLEQQGGAWQQDDEARKALLLDALNALSAVDIEAASAVCPALCEQAAELHKPVIVSHHDFAATPDFNSLAAIVRGVHRWPTALPKLATLAESAEDVAVLERLTTTFAAARPICVLGMGAHGPATRRALPRLGSALTYGYLDRPVAPGQVAASELRTMVWRQGPP